MDNLPALQGTAIMNLVAQAIDKGVAVETMERLLAMGQALKMDYAKEQFDSAMSGFQAECPIIIKTKPVKDTYGRVAYYYAPLDSIVTQVKELIHKYQFSYLLQTETLVEGVKVTTIVKHALGHSEQSSVQLPLIRQTKLMSDAHVVEGTLTIAKRLSFCNAFGVLTGDEDTNAVVMKQAASEDEIALIRALLVEAQSVGCTFTEETIVEGLNSKGYKISSLDELIKEQVFELARNMRTIIEKRKNGI